LPYSGYIPRESGEDGKLDLDALSDDLDEEDDFENIKKLIKKTKNDNEKASPQK
jgi:hypothetical protein